MASATEKILEEGLCCGICHETFRRPKSLPCGHTFCEECLTELATSFRDICCPMCRREVPLPTDGVAGLPTDYRLAEMSKKFSEVTVEQDIIQRCEYHPSEHLRYFCKTSKCDVPICGQCIGDSHSGHSIVSLKQAVEKRMEKVNPLLEEKKRQIEEHVEYLKEIQQLENTITDVKFQSEKNIQDSYAERAKLLAEDKDRLLSDVQKSYQDAMKDISTKTTAVQQQIKTLEDVVEDVEQIKEKHPIKFLRNEPDELREKLEEIKVVPLLSPLEVMATIFHPHKIEKEQLVNGELVSEVFTSRRQTFATRLSNTCKWAGLLTARMASFQYWIVE
ncbi:tripartite motif-containing protein 59-like [Branchiostoma floridae]|uniref:Tripartite motif-containing protein 59-like n=1 Tax=Branchiostoma floridae TaxID=7739 RepID=A0A9J7MTS3_BRAFL|nr:tripartite motif-containing protein 59-like [Branchiostoma floridae]